MPPVLDPSKSKVDGLAFLGLSLQRKSDGVGHPDSDTHQTAFDLNQVLDRDYEYLSSTNDDGWLVGGGEAGPPTSYKLAAKDSAHVEIMRIGTYKKEWGGIPVSDIVDAIESGKIHIPQIEVVPTAVVANHDKPPELEIRFDMEKPSSSSQHGSGRVPPPPDTDADGDEMPLPVNWQLRFLHNQLFKHFQNPSRFCPGAFHSTIVRKAEFRSPKARNQYFDKCKKVVEGWKKDGPKPLVPESIDDSVTQVKSKTKDSSSTDDCKSGLWLFTDRKTTTHYFEPNFLPPYNTPEKKQIIFDSLKEEWDEKSSSWKPAKDLRHLEKHIHPPPPPPHKKKEEKEPPHHHKKPAPPSPPPAAKGEEDKPKPDPKKKDEAKPAEKEEKKEEPKSSTNKPEDEEESKPKAQQASSKKEEKQQKQPEEVVVEGGGGEEKKEDVEVQQDPAEACSFSDELSIALQKKHCTDCGVGELLDTLLNKKSNQ